MTTVGTEDDFQYFAPRILEICATENGWWPEPAIVFDKMEKAGWHRWPAEQVSAIRIFVWVNFLRVLSQEDCGDAVDDWICAVAKGREDLTPYLAEVERQPAKLIQFYEQNSEALIKGHLSNPFWEDIKLAQPVVRWFRSTQVTEIINRIYGI